MARRSWAWAAAYAAVALAAVGAAAAAPSARETPDQFVGRLMAIYQPDGSWWKDWPLTPAGRRAEAAYQNAIYAAFYDPVFVKLMTDNSTLAAAKGGGADLDYDPVCQCQDMSERYAYVSGAPSGAFFDAVVKSDGDQAHWTLVLSKTPAGWRLYDVIDQSGDVRARLIKHNACLRAARTEKAAGECIS